MRIIKFRAWLSGTHDNITFGETKMDYSVVLSSKGYWCSVEGGWDIHGCYPTIPIMQFTGLKDKNGKEIYEGDLLNNEMGVVWSKYAFVPAYDWGRSDDFEDWGTNWNENIHVIGNIYENPELINPASSENT